MALYNCTSLSRYCTAQLYLLIKVIHCIMYFLTKVLYRTLVKALYNFPIKVLHCKNVLLVKVLHCSLPQGTALDNCISFKYSTVYYFTFPSRYCKYIVKYYTTCKIYNISILYTCNNSHLFAQWKGSDEADLVPAKEANLKIPQVASSY